MFLEVAKKKIFEEEEERSCEEEMIKGSFFHGLNEKQHFIKI